MATVRIDGRSGEGSGGIVGGMGMPGMGTRRSRDLSEGDMGDLCHAFASNEGMDADVCVSSMGSVDVGVVGFGVDETTVEQNRCAWHRRHWLQLGRKNSDRIGLLPELGRDTVERMHDGDLQAVEYYDWLYVDPQPTVDDAEFDAAVLALDLSVAAQGTGRASNDDFVPMVTERERHDAKRRSTWAADSGHEMRLVDQGQIWRDPL